MGERVNPGGGGGGGVGGGGKGGGTVVSGSGGTSLAFRPEDDFNLGDEESPWYPIYFIPGGGAGGGGGTRLISETSGEGGSGDSGIIIGYGYAPPGGNPPSGGGSGGNPIILQNPPSTKETPFRPSGTRAFFREDDLEERFRRRRKLIQPMGTRPPEIQREIKAPGGFGETVEKSIGRRESAPRYAGKEDDFFTKLFKFLLPP